MKDLGSVPSTRRKEGQKQKETGVHRIFWTDLKHLETPGRARGYYRPQPREVAPSQCRKAVRRGGGPGLPGRPGAKWTWEVAEAGAGGPVWGPSLVRGQ